MSSHNGTQWALCWAMLTLRHVAAGGCDPPPIVTARRGSPHNILGRVVPAPGWARPAVTGGRGHHLPQSKSHRFSSLHFRLEQRRALCGGAPVQNSTRGLRAALRGSRPQHSRRTALNTPQRRGLLLQSLGEELGTPPGLVLCLAGWVASVACDRQGGYTAAVQVLLD